MPLAIAQAKQFWHKAPSATKDTRFSFMDFVQIAADGLMSAVDKFVLPGGLEANPALIRVWRAVAIGRMKGNFIEMFSETTIHFFPQDKRKLYRANKHLKEFSGQIDFERLAVAGEHRPGRRRQDHGLRAGESHGRRLEHGRGFRPGERRRPSGRPDGARSSC
jgi:hypothetical protein